MGASAGRVLLIPKGDWNAETTYTGLDWVRHNGAAWVCKNTCTNVEPTEENSDNWQIIARDGQSGSVTNVDAAMSDTSENPVQNKVIKKYVDDHSTDVADMTGATATQNGTHGLVPAPQIGDEKKALLGDGTWGSVDAILTFKTKEEYDAAVVNDEIPDGAKVIKEYDEGDSTTIIDVDTVMSDTSVNPVQNKVVKKYVDEKQVNIDGITLTLDEARNVIKLADALKDKIGSALQPESIANNQVTTETGFALDARQANPNIDGTLANQISQLNTENIGKGLEDADDAIEGGYNGVLYPSANNGVRAYAYCFCFNLRKKAYIQIAIGYRMTENTERYIWVRTKYSDIWSNWYKTALTT